MMSFIKKFNSKFPEKWDLTTKWTWVVVLAWVMPFIFSTGLLLLSERVFRGNMLLWGAFAYFMATVGLGLMFTVLIAMFRTTFD